MKWLETSKYFTKKSNIVGLTVILISGIILMIIGGFFTGDSQTKTPQNVIPDSPSVSETSYGSYEQALERKLEEILSQIEGVGKNRVMITYASTAEKIPAKDTKDSQSTTVETDAQGGRRESTGLDSDNKILVYNGQGGVQQVLILRELTPRIRGVIVAAEGANDVKVKSDIFDAVRTLLGVTANSVQVFVKETNEK